MSVIVDFTILPPSGFDMHDLLSDMADGLFSTSAAGTELVTFTRGPTTLSFTGTFNETKTSVTSVSLETGSGTVQFTMDAGGVEIYSAGGMGGEFAPLPGLFVDAYINDLRVNFTGGTGGDLGWGTKRQDTMLGNDGDDTLFGWGAKDVIKGGKGHDMMAGGRGNDTLKGGNGRDLLLGGDHDDKLRGENGHDLLITGPGQDNANGGNGNDVVAVTGNSASVRGGLGRDLIIVNSVGSTAGSNPDGFTSHVRDYDPSFDVLIFAGVASTAGGDPDGFTTLADVANGTLDGFSWNENAKGTVIRSGDARVVVHGVDADQIDLDYILFTTTNAIGTAETFDPANGGGVLASGFNGDALIAFGSETSTFTTTDGTAWDLYAGDVMGFASTASGSPNV